MELEKAYIQPLDAKGNNKGERILAMFNPEQYTVDKTVNYQRTNLPGLQTPITQFVYGNAQTLKIDLFFDAYDKGEDVRKYTKKITKLLDIDSDLHAPPVCKFMWGKLEFKAVIDSVSENFTMFQSSGVPVRSKLTISFTEYKTFAEQLPPRPLESADRVKYRRITQADSLWSLADKAYGDPGQWRVIARANKITNPRLLEPGAELTIPALR